MNYLYGHTMLEDKKNLLRDIIDHIAGEMEKRGDKLVVLYNPSDPKLLKIIAEYDRHLLFLKDRDDTEQKIMRFWGSRKTPKELHKVVKMYPRMHCKTAFTYALQKEKERLKRCSENFSKGLDELGELLATNAIKFYGTDIIKKEEIMFGIGRTMSEEDKKLRAIRESIAHWEKDIVKPLKEGDTIERRGRSKTWKRSGDNLETGSGYCALCVFMGFSVMDDSRECEECPLSQAGFGCTEKDSAYRKFYSDLTLETAQNMVLILKNVLIDALEEKRRNEKPEYVKTAVPKIKKGQIWKSKTEGCYHVIIDVEEDGLNKDYCLSGRYTYSHDDFDILRFFDLCPNAKITVEEK